MDITRTVLFLCVLYFGTVDIVMARKSREKTRDKSRKTRRRHKSIPFDTIELIRHPTEKTLADDIKRSDKVSDIIETVCLPKGTDRLVYRFQNDSHIFIGFDVIKDGIIKSMTWELKQGNTEVLLDRGTNEYDMVRADDLRHSLTDHDILAATNKRQQNQFQQDMKLCQSSFTPRSCLIQAFAESARKMKKVKFHPDCSHAKHVHSR